MNKNDIDILWSRAVVIKNYLMFIDDKMRVEEPDSPWRNDIIGAIVYVTNTIELFGERLGKVRNQSTHPGEFICSECGAKTKLATVTRDGEHPSEPSYCPNCGREVAHG